MKSLLVDDNPILSISATEGRNDCLISWHKEEKPSKQVDFGCKVLAKEMMNTKKSVNEGTRIGVLNAHAREKDDKKISRREGCKRD